MQDAFLKISRHEGVSSLWSGLSPTLVLALPATVIYFVSYEQLRSRLKGFSNRHEIQRLSSSGNLDYRSLSQPSWVPLVAGSTARVWSVSVVSPLELIRTKMQSERLSYLREYFGRLKCAACLTCTDLSALFVSRNESSY